MRIKRAEKAGFCFGVKRAIEMAEKAAQTGNTASLGPLIHNQQVVDYLASKGIKQIGAIQDLADGQQLVIRSHGVPPEIYAEAKARNIGIIDATCPFVQKAQRLAAEAAKDSYVVVVGDRSHPEVIGILGWAGENSRAVETLEEARELPYYPRIAVLAQTTQPKSNFSAIAEELKKHTDQLIVHNTICSATEERQASAAKLAEDVDLMIVVGGRSSSNTRKLWAICAEKTKTYLIETANELQEIWFEDAKSVGLTAGASTPDWIIEEVYKKMSEIMEKTNEALDIAQAEPEKNVVEPKEETVEENTAVNNEDEERTMESFENELPKIYGGAIVKGTVVKITEEEVFVDIGWKSEGVIPIDELTATKVLDINDVVKVGDTLRAMVTKVENNEGYTVLSRKRVAEYEAKERLAKAAENKEEIQGKVTEVVKGGLVVDLGMRGFIPASQIELGFVEDLNKYIGKTLRLRIIEFDPNKKKLVLSQKAILAEEQIAKREQLLQSLKEGDVVKGIVRRLTNFGAFVDLGGIDGLLHVSDMAFSRVNNPADLVKVDDEVEVQVLSVDREKGRISLGLKQLREDPWARVGEKYPLNSIVQGRVVRIAPFGAFVQLEDGVDALVHISQLSDRRVAKVEDVVQVGEIISAKVIECKPEEKRISLSIKELILDSLKAIDQELLANQEQTPEVTIGDAVGDIAKSNESSEE
ncbi:MAG TPA: bifunctional 4-hydroxy-3-methylbut-2-enyl diphosphate reductase/30S ribosomal protein S1 [Peptococcaceae bacterium]|nr:bifunctional 4-hydroxy-3-methylbut-2-enyl diphosphate reductase/30S ribosomal protein S1 [Peptococcaceae bacterium]